MRKLLVVVLVLCSGSLASGAYVMEQVAPDVAHVIGDGVFGAAFIVTGGGTADVVMTYEGDMAALTEYAGVDPDLDALAEMILGAPATSLIFATVRPTPALQMPRDLRGRCAVRR